MNPWRYSIALLCAPVSLVLAQTPFAQPSITTTTTTVLIPALIQTKSGAPVFTLTAQNFAVTDDGIPQKITLDENTGSEPIALVVAIQTGGAGAHQLEKYRRIAPLIEALIGNVPHSLALVTFDSQPTLAQPFLPDTSQLSETLNDLQEGDHGAAILDALAFSVNLLREEPPNYRRAILLISETIDRTTDNTISILAGSKTGTSATPGSHTTLEQALRVIGETNTAIYSLAFSSLKATAKHEAPKTLGSSPFYSYQAPPGPPGGCFAKDPNPDPADSTNRAVQACDCLILLAPPLRIAKIAAQLAMNSLQRNVPETVAHLTGGEYFAFSSERSLERDLITLANHIPNRYMLSFHPPSPHPGPHSLSIHLPDYPNLTITARTTWWAEVPSK